MSKTRSHGSTAKRDQDKRSKASDEDRQIYVDNLRSMHKFTAVADWKGRLQFATEAPVRALGYSESDFLQKPFWEASWFSQSSESQRIIRDSLEEAMGGNSTECRVETFPTKGPPLPVTFNITPMKGTSGDVISIVAETDPLLIEDKEASAQVASPKSQRFHEEAIFELMQEAYFETDSSDTLIAISPSAARILGYESPSQMIGQKAVGWWADHKERIKLLIELSRKGKVEKHSASFLKKDGSVVPIELDVRLYLNDKKGPPGIQGVFRDLSPIRNLEKQLQEARSTVGKTRSKGAATPIIAAAEIEDLERHFAAFAEQTRDGIAIIQRNTIKFANAHFAQMLGYRVEELLERRFTRALWPDSIDVEAPAETTPGAMPEPGELEITRKDGTPATVEFSSCETLHEGQPAYFILLRDTVVEQKTLQALREAAAGWRFVLDHVPDIITTVSQEGGILFTNRELLTAESGQEVPATSAYDYFPAECREQVSQALNCVFQERRAVQFETAGLGPGGTYLWYSCRAGPVERGGEVISAVVVCTDITTTKEAARLKMSEERLSALFEYAPDCCYLHDQEGYLIDGNRAFEEVTGWAREDLLGKHLLESGLLSPEDIPRVTRLLEASNQRCTGPYEIALVRKDGHRVTVEIRTYPINIHGQTQVLGIARDITERKKAEAARREAEQRYRVIFDNPLNMVFINDARGTFLEANDSAIKRFGFTRDDLGKVAFQDVAQPEDLPKILSSLAHAVTEGYMDKPVELRAISKTGEVIWVEAYGYPLAPYEGQYRGLAIARDITERKKAEEALRESQEKLAGVVSSITDDMTMVDAQFNIVWANDVAMKRLGPEILGKKCYNVYHNSDRPCEPCWVARTFIDGQVHEHETEILLPDGNARCFWSTSGVAARHDDGRPRLVVEISRDITARRKSEQALRESEQRYRLIADNVADVIWTTRFDLTNFTYVSPSILRQQGFTVEESLKRDPLSTIPPPQRDLAVNTLAEQLGREARGEVRHDESVVLELQQYRKDGSLIWTEIETTFLRDDNGKAVGILGVTRDITQRKQAEAALRKSEERYRILVETAPEVIFTLSAEDGTITSLNSAFENITGWSRLEWIDRPLMELIHPDDLSTATETFLRAVNGEPPQTFEAHFISSYHKNLIGEVIATGLAEDGEVVEVFGFVRDITQRKEAEKALAHYADQLASSNAELQQFAYVASHDLQEPLRKVKSFTELLAERYQGKLDDKADKYINYIVDGAGRMQTLIRDLLTYSRVATRGKPFEPTPFEEVLSQALDNLELSINEASANITHDPLPVLRADSGQMIQLFQNLVGNAIKFRKKDEPPHLHISTEQRKDDWLFSIRDNGIGFESQYAERIFVIFQRLHTREEYSGTGIGLAVCKRIVERHRGRIWAESTPGEGSNFYFTIPLNIEEGGKYD